MKESNIFILQGCIKLNKTDSKDIYNITKDVFAENSALYHRIHLHLKLCRKHLFLFVTFHNNHVYSPSCCSKSIRLSFIETQMKIFFMNSENFLFLCIDSYITNMFKAQKDIKDIISPCDISGSNSILWSYKNTFCGKNKKNWLDRTILLFLFPTFLGLECGSCFAVHAGSESAQIS